MNDSEYYRNKVHIFDIEPGSLWELKNDRFVLVDDDQYIYADYPEYDDYFYQVPKPDELN